MQLRLSCGKRLWSLAIPAFVGCRARPLPCVVGDAFILICPHRLVRLRGLRVMAFGSELNKHEEGSRAAVEVFAAERGALSWSVKPLRPILYMLRHVA